VLAAGYGDLSSDDGWPLRDLAQACGFEPAEEAAWPGLMTDNWRGCGDCGVEIDTGGVCEPSIAVAGR